MEKKKTIRHLQQNTIIQEINSDLVQKPEFYDKSCQFCEI